MGCLRDDKVAWYENDGTGVFGAEQVIASDADGTHSVYTADLDGDGDQDVISGSRFDKKIAWYENDGNAVFGPPLVISTDAAGAHAVYAADLDGDGDPDVVSASLSDDKVAWYENDGSGAFGPQIILTTNAEGATALHVADLDGDGDLDVLSASNADNKIAWYRNNLSALNTGTDDDRVDLPSEIGIKIFPNPVSKSLFVQLDATELGSYRIGVFDILGRRLLQAGRYTPGANGDTHILDMSLIPAGLYAIRIEGATGVRSRLVAVTR